MRRLAKNGYRTLIKTQGLEGHRQSELFIERSVARKIPLIAHVRQKHEDPKAHHLAMKVASRPIDRTARVIERMGNARIVVKVLLIGEV